MIVMIQNFQAGKHTEKGISVLFIIFMLFSRTSMENSSHSEPGAKSHKNTVDNTTKDKEPTDPIKPLSNDGKAHFVRPWLQLSQLLWYLGLLIAVVL